MGEEETTPPQPSELEQLVGDFAASLNDFLLGDSFLSEKSEGYLNRFDQVKWFFINGHLERIAIFTESLVALKEVEVQLLARQVKDQADASGLIGSREHRRQNLFRP